MRFAVVNEIQGNAVALGAVLDDIERRYDDIEQVVSAGDLVGRGPQPNEVIDLMRSKRIESVRGNYDDAVAFERMGSGADFASRGEEVDDARAIAWTRMTVTPENLAFLQGLPQEIRLRPEFRGIQVERVREDARVREYRRTFLMRSLLGGLARENRRPLSRTLRVLLVHGSPRALNEFVRGATADSLLQAMSREANADVVVTGHASEGFVRPHGSVTFVGVGGVSAPAADSPVAHYAVVTVTDTVEAEFQTVAYDAAPYRAAMHASGLPAGIQTAFLR